MSDCQVSGIGSGLVKLGIFTGLSNFVSRGQKASFSCSEQTTLWELDHEDIITGRGSYNWTQVDIATAMVFLKIHSIAVPWGRGMLDRPLDTPILDSCGIPCIKCRFQDLQEELVSSPGYIIQIEPTTTAWSNLFDILGLFIIFSSKIIHTTRSIPFLAFKVKLQVKLKSETPGGNL